MRLQQLLSHERDKACLEVTKYEGHNIAHLQSRSDAHQRAQHLRLFFQLVLAHKLVQHAVELANLESGISRLLGAKGSKEVLRVQVEVVSLCHARQVIFWGVKTVAQLQRWCKLEMLCLVQQGASLDQVGAKR